METNLTVSFHIGRGGRFHNAGHLTWTGEKNFQDLQKEHYDCLFLRDRDERGKFITPTLFADNGNIVSDDDPNGIVGTLDFDGEYDTHYCKYVEDCTHEELEIIKKSNDYKSLDLIVYLNKKTTNMKTKITLEDNGQDFLQFICNEDGIIIETRPFQGYVWNGAYIPLDSPELMVGEECPIHNPPHINYGYLKHKVEEIETLND